MVVKASEDSKTGYIYFFNPKKNWNTVLPRNRTFPKYSRANFFRESVGTYFSVKFKNILLCYILAAQQRYLLRTYSIFPQTLIQSGSYIRLSWYGSRYSCVTCSNEKKMDRDARQKQIKCFCSPSPIQPWNSKDTMIQFTVNNENFCTQQKCWRIQQKSSDYCRRNVEKTKLKRIRVMRFFMRKFSRICAMRRNAATAVEVAIWDDASFGSQHSLTYFPRINTLSSSAFGLALFFGLPCRCANEINGHPIKPLRP